MRLRALPALFVSLAVALFALPAAAEAGFTVRNAAAPNWTSASDIAVADFNDDGIEDLATASDGDVPSVGVLTGNADGTFSEAWSYDLLVNAWQVVPGDFDQDGTIDLVVVSALGTQLFLGTPDLFPGDLDVSFGPPVMVDPDGTDVAAADINGDGDLDLAESVRDGKIGILIGGPGATFGPRTDIVLGSPGSGVYGTVAGDFNEDDDVDLATQVDGGDIEVLLGTAGNDGFAPATGYDAGPGNPAPLIGDFDGDGHQDIAAVNFEISPMVMTVSALDGAGDGTFGPVSTVGQLPYPSSDAGIGDFDGDGRDDLMVGEGGDHVDAFFGDAAGSTVEWERSRVAVPPYPSAIATSDLDGDDLDEAIVWDSEGISVLDEDSVPPETTIDAGQTDPTDETPTFTFHSSEAGSTFMCWIDSEAEVPCDDGTFTPATPLGEGSHVFHVAAIDPAGNRDPDPATSDFTIAIPPETTIDTGPSDPTDDDTPTFTFSSSEAGTFQCWFDSVAPVACNGGTFTPPTALTDGSHTFNVEAIDAHGNRDLSAATATFLVAVPPETTIDSPAPGLTNQQSPTFSFHSSEDGSSFACEVDGGPAVPCDTGTFTPSSPLAQGDHTFKVKATDPAGNEDPTPAAKDIRVDSLQPVVNITNGPPPTTNDSTPTFQFSGTDASPITYRCSIDAGQPQACTTPFTPPTLSDGSHTFHLDATDAAGNAADPETRTFTVDATPPDTTISAVDEFVTETRVTVSFTTMEGARFECSLDHDSFTPCTGPKTYSGLADRAHSIRVRSFDEVNNADPTPAEADFTVDTHAPDTTIVSGPDGPTNAASFTFTSPDGTADFACRIDNAAFSACDPDGFTPVSIPDGPHAFEVRAKDRAGNFDATPARREFVLDTETPEITIGRIAKRLTDRTPTIRFSVDEAVEGFRCEVDGTGLKPCSQPLTPRRLRLGKHTITVIAADAAGNEGSAKARFKISRKRG